MGSCCVLSEDFVQEVTNLAQNILPSTSEFLEESEARLYRNDMRAFSYYVRNEPAKTHPYFICQYQTQLTYTEGSFVYLQYLFVFTADKFNEYHSNIMDTYVEREEQKRREDRDTQHKVSECIKKMRAVKGLCLYGQYIVSY